METRVAGIDLAAPGAETELFAATDGVEIGLFVYNAGADTINDYFLDHEAEEWHAMLRRNCPCRCSRRTTTHRRWSARKRGGIILVTSGAAWAGGGRLTTYGGTKAFDLIFAEGLWAELKRDDVDVLSLVVGATDTPSLRASLDKFGVAVEDLAQHGGLAESADVARAGLEHLGDGPTWQMGVPDGAGPSLLAGAAPPSGRGAHHPGPRHAVRRLSYSGFWKTNCSISGRMFTSTCSMRTPSGSRWYVKFTGACVPSRPMTSSGQRVAEIDGVAHEVVGPEADVVQVGVLVAHPHRARRLLDQLDVGRLGRVADAVGHDDVVAVGVAQLHRPLDDRSPFEAEQQTEVVARGLEVGDDDSHVVQLAPGHACSRSKSGEPATIAGEIASPVRRRLLRLT